MPATASALDQLTLNIVQEMHVRSSLTATFAALLEEIGPSNQDGNGNSLRLTLEVWPGGRWFRDLGDNNGHLWGHVQAIKRPTLLEITGPLMMSTGVINNLQYRLKEVDGGTLITFRHTGFGLIQDDWGKNLNEGWTEMLERVRKRAEAA